MEKIEELRDYAIYDLRTILNHLGELGNGMTFQELQSFFREMQLIPKKEIDTYIEENIEKMQEYSLIKCSSSLRDEIVSESRKNGFVEMIKSEREKDYNNFLKQSEALSHKGRSYLEILSYIGWEEQSPDDVTYYENLLKELDISYYETALIGRDIKRVIVPLFVCQERLSGLIERGNDLKTYEKSSRSPLPVDQSCFSDQILEIYGGKNDGTQIKMTDEQKQLVEKCQGENRKYTINPVSSTAPTNDGIALKKTLKD